VSHGVPTVERPSRWALRCLVTPAGVAGIWLGLALALWLCDPLLDPTRASARLAVLAYGVAVLFQLTQQAFSSPRDSILARWLWLAACLLYLLHVLAAFHYFHHWSHQAAVAHVEQQSGFGPGIYFSHAFGLVWLVDALWWCGHPNGHARRPAWIGWSVHGFLAFLTFNAAVVYATGVMRIMGIVLFSLLLLTTVARWLFRGSLTG
jgi:hypothetical protein